MVLTVIWSLVNELLNCVYITELLEDFLSLLSQLVGDWVQIKHVAGSPHGPFLGTRLSIGLYRIPLHKDFFPYFSML